MAGPAGVVRRCSDSVTHVPNPGDKRGQNLALAYLAKRPSLARADSTAEESGLTICPLRENTFLPIHEIDVTAWEPP